MKNETEELAVEHREPPTTVREVGIHLIYMSKSMAEIKNTLATMSTSFATKAELADAIEDRHTDQKVIENKIVDLDKRVTKIETMFNGIIYKIAGTAVVMLVVMVLAYYGLEKYFK